MPQPVKPHYVLNYFMHASELCHLSKSNIDISTLSLIWCSPPFSYQFSLQMKSPHLSGSTEYLPHAIIHLLPVLLGSCDLTLQTSNSVSCRHAPCMRPVMLRSSARRCCHIGSAVAPQHRLCLAFKQQKSNGGGAGQPGQQRGWGSALLRKAGILVAGRWSQCIPPKQLPIGSQWSRARHWMRGKIMVGLSSEHLPLRSRETDKKRTPSVWLWVQRCLFPHLDSKVSLIVPSSIDNPSTARGVSLFMSSAVFYYLVLKLSCKCTDRQCVRTQWY